MISQEEKCRFHESLKCKDCKGWLKHCNAECCKIVYVNIDPIDLEGGGRFLSIKPENPLSLNDQRYYMFRGVQYVRGFLRFRKDRIVVVGKLVTYVHPCARLKNNLCEIQDTKPELCKAINLETANLPGQPFRVTDNCLFKYKGKEVINDGEER